MLGLRNRTVPQETVKQGFLTKEQLMVFLFV